MPFDIWSDLALTALCGTALVISLPAHANGGLIRNRRVAAGTPERVRLSHLLGREAPRLLALGLLLKGGRP